MTDSPLELRTNEDYARFLRENYGWQIQEPWFSTVPEPEERFVGSHTEEVSSIREALLSTYVIQDSYGKDHTARREFRKQLEQEQPALAKWISAHDKLRGRKVIGTLYNMDLLLSPLKQKDTSLWALLTEIFTPEVGRPSGQYHEMEFDEKVEYARVVEDAAYRFLAAMTDNKGMRRVLTMWNALSGAQYHLQTQPELEKTKTTFTINRFSSGVRPDALDSEVGIYDVGELVKNAYILELVQKCGIPRGAEKEPLRDHVEGVLYQQTMGSDVFVAVQHDNDKDYMKLTLLLDPDSPVKDKAIDATHGFLQRLAIKQVEAPKHFGY